MRLLKLHPGTSRWLRCSLLTTCDDPPPEYEAVSCVWGSQTDLRSIYLDKRLYFVTANLFRALHRMRLRDRDRMLWIDALVINQSDLAERTIEVGKMSTIFSRAEGTLVWLGQGNSQIEQDMGTLVNCNVEKVDLSTEGIGQQMRFAVDRILGLTYWDRAWVVQELMYSNELGVLLLYGSTSLEWDHFVKIVDKGIQKICLEWSDMTFGEVKLAIRPGSGRRKEHMRLPTWLDNYCCRRNCTEPRDRVFAFHGCFPPEVRACVRIDYTRSMERIALDITLAWIDSERDLDFLSQIGCREKWTSSQHVPTWVPNYFCTPTITSGLSSATPSKSTSQTTSTPCCRVLDNCSVLEVNGLWLGSINAISKPPSEKSRVEGLDTYLLDSILRCEGLINDLEPGLRELVSICFDREDLEVKFAEGPHIVQNIAAAYDFSRDEGTLYYIGALISRFFSVRRVSFRFAPVESSRLAQKGSVSIPFGFGTLELKVGDRVCLVVGCRLPLILRSVGEQYMVIGSAHVFGFHSGLDLQGKLSEYPSEVIEKLELC